MKPLLKDGFLSLISGQDSGRNPVLLQPTQASYLRNVTVRGGFPETRYGFKKRTLKFENDEVEAWFADHLCQMADYFAASAGREVLITSIGGRIFRIDVLRDYTVTDITPRRSTYTTADFITPPLGGSVTLNAADTSLIYAGYPLFIGSGRYTLISKTSSTLVLENVDAIPGKNVIAGTRVYFLHPNPSLLPRAWALQAENYFLIQNNSDSCIIYDGATSRRAVRAGTVLEVPTGSSMAYWQGRVWVAVRDREIEAGDIFGGPTRIIDFTETIYLTEGGKFRVPSNLGNISALKVLPVLDTSLGQGPLQVHTELGISTLNLPSTRARWKDVDSPIQPISLVNYGATSYYGTVVVNGDVFFRAKDGLRSFVLARRDFGSWGNVPASREMQRVMASDDQKFLQYSSAVLFDNLLLFTVNPLPVNGGRSAYWQGLGVLDFDLLSGIGQKSPPVYAGVWDGLNVSQIAHGTFDGRERCFIFARNSDDENEVWEIDPKSRFDGECGRIKSRIEARLMDFGRPYQLHELQNAELWVDNVEGEVSFSLQHRPDGSPCWVDWGAEKTLCSTTRECVVPEGNCFSFKQFKPSYKTRIGFGQPPDTTETTDDKPSRIGYLHQPCLEWTGHARIKGLIMHAQEVPEPAFANCD